MQERGICLYKRIIAVLAILSISTLVLGGCNRGNTFFDSRIQSDTVQDGKYILTDQGLRERTFICWKC